MGDNARGSIQRGQTHQQQQQRGVLVDVKPEGGAGKQRRQGLAPQQLQADTSSCQSRLPREHDGDSEEGGEGGGDDTNVGGSGGRRRMHLDGSRTGADVDHAGGRAGPAPDDDGDDDDDDDEQETGSGEKRKLKKEEKGCAVAHMLVDGGLYLQRGRDDPKLLLQVANALTKRYNVPVTEIHFFDACVEKDYHDFPGMQRINEERRRFREGLLALGRDAKEGGVHVEMHLCHLKPIAVPCPDAKCPKHHPQNPNVRAIQAGVDVDIAAHALTGPAMDATVTHLYCWLGDGDLAPTLEALRGPRFNKRIRILNTDPAALSIGLRAVTSKREIINVFELLKANSA